MELAKNIESNKRFSGLGLFTLLAGVVIFSPFIYFMILWALGEIPDVSGGMVK